MTTGQKRGCAVEPILISPARTFYVDARMMPLVPKKTAVSPGQLFPELNDLLLSFQEFLGATAGWIGLQDVSGRWTFPVHTGAFSASWLPWSQDYGGVWSFTISSEPILFNDLKLVSPRGGPPLGSLLSCPLIHNKTILGHIALANKARGFSAEDTIVLQALAYYVAHRYAMIGTAAAPRAPIALAALWRRILDQAAEGILLLDESGVLIYANAAWLHWTGFRAEELLGRTAPFPFWVSQQELMQVLCTGLSPLAGVLPFRRRDQSLFWCRVETAAEQWDDQLLTVAFLRQTDTLSSLRMPTPDWLPLLLDLDNGIEGWDSRWQERTGLSVSDVEKARCDLILDWLFPQQRDRDCIADCFTHPYSTGYQFILEMAAANGSRPTLCTFLPLSTRAVTPLPRRWLLLAGEVERRTNVSRLVGSTPVG
jgi:PAS domain S-box-containing protein